MSSDVKFLSIKSLIIWVVVSITSAALIIASGVNLYIKIDNYHQSIKNDVIVFSDLVSRSSIKYIKENDVHTEENNLKALGASQIIENVHIYKVLEDGSIAFFASYNKEGIAPVKAKLEQIKELSAPQLSGDVVEIIQPIKDQNIIIGYTYLRTSTERLKQSISSSIFITSCIFILCVLICFIFTYRLQKSIISPMSQFAL